MTQQPNGYCTFTGARDSHDSAFLNLDARYRLGFGTPGHDWFAFSTLIGCIDAPAHIPTGAMNSTQCMNGHGRPVPHITAVSR